MYTNIICISMYVYTHVYLCVCIYICTCMFICTRALWHLAAQADMTVRAAFLRTSDPTADLAWCHVHIYLDIYVHISAYICIYLDICECTHIHMAASHVRV